MTASAGIAPLDDRTGGLEEGGLYLLSSPPISARTAAVVQFLGAGLTADGRAGLVGRVPPERLFRSARRFGRPLEEAWRDGRLRLVGFRGEYEVRLSRAASPGEVYGELASLLEPAPSRLAFDPGTVLWEGRGDGAAAAAFVDFVEGVSATALATTTRDLGGELPLSTEFVGQAAAGIFQLREEGGGLLRLTIQKLEGGRPDPSDVTLALREGEGLTAPGETPARRASDRAAEAGDELLWLALAGRLPEEIESWIRRAYPVTGAEEPLDLVARLQSDRAYGLVLVSLGRERLEQGRRACRVCRRLRPGLPVVVLSEEPFRASDRADLLRDGADECMTGGLNVEELASRLELARRRSGAGSRAGVPEAEGEREARRPAPGPAGGDGRRDGRPEGPLDEAAFRSELRERLEVSGPRVFTVVRFVAEEPGAAAGRLSELVRDEEGDFAGVLDGASAVWLSGTVPSEAAGFVRRVLDAVREAAGAETVETEILGSARDADRLRELAG